LFINSEFIQIGYPEDWTSLTDMDVSEFVWWYSQTLDLSVSKEEWFAQLKEYGSSIWYATNNKEFKLWWYKGKVWDLAMILRIALCKSSRTPDLYETMQVMWADKIQERLEKLVE
jgi:hypothetical protein